MPTAVLFPDTELPWRHICTHWEGWQKGSGIAFACRLSMSFTYVLERFATFWDAFIERESEHDGTGPPDGCYAALASLGYPSLATILEAYPGVFAAVIMEGLQPEFAGYVLPSPAEVEKGGPRYFLTGVTSVAVADGQVVLVGACATFWRR